MNINFYSTDHWILSMVNYGKTLEFPVQIQSGCDPEKGEVALKTDRVIINISRKELNSNKSSLKGGYTVIKDKRSGPATIEIKNSGEIKIFPDPNRLAVNIFWTLKKT